MRLWKRTREQMGDEAREIFAREPPQDDAMGIVLNAWDDLQTERPIGMGEGRIPRSACRDWCKEHGLGDAEARVLWTVIKQTDVEELERRAHEAKSQAPIRPAEPTGRR